MKAHFCTFTFAAFCFMADPAHAVVVDFSGNIGNGYYSFAGRPSGPNGPVEGSPFVYELSKMSEFYLEDFEDHLLNTPYLTSLTGYPEPYGRISIRGIHELGLGGLPQSVDGDDGVIDGHGMLGDSWFGQVTLQFSTNAEGRLPNYAGLVITSGYAYAGGGEIPAFDAYGPDGEFIMSLSVRTSTFQDDGMNGVDTKADTFVGLYASQGISRLVATPFIAIEIDHVQYGWSIPEPSGAAMAAAGGAFLLLRRRRTAGR